MSASGRWAFTALSRPRAPYSLLSAFSRMQQVLSTMTSASSRTEARSYPSSSSSPGDPLGIVLVHLAPEGADGVGSGHRPRLEPRSRRASGQLISRRS